MHIVPDADFEKSEEIGVCGLMPKSDPLNHGDHPVSRDWADVDCQSTSCANNTNLKCTVPSLCVIDSNGRCLGFKAQINWNKVIGDA